MFKRRLNKNLTYKDIVSIALTSNARIKLRKQQLKKIVSARQIVEKICANDKPIYGINTGVGALATITIPKNKLSELQHNIIQSHAVGIDKPLSKELSKMVLFLLVNSLAKGYSGVRLKLIEFLINLFNKDIIPVIPSKGSLGASGDLAPLAHLALTILGKGKVWRKNKIYRTKNIFKKHHIQPLRLEAKEGLSLINGTYVMTAMACFSVWNAEILINSADIIGAMSLEAIKGSIKPFLAVIHKLKPYPGQKKSAATIRNLLKDSEILQSHSHCGKIQDPYSFRCIPQVHGDCRDIWHEAVCVVNTEINSTTDNPIVIKEIISGGNFHGARLSSVMRFLAGALINLAAISERRINHLLDGSSGHLPKFLIKNSGLESGLMIMQNTAADLLTDSKTLCPPSYTDSIPVCANQEDYVSMGMSACRRAQEICENTAGNLAIELLCATQGLEFIQKKPGSKIHKTYKLVRENIFPFKRDRVMQNDIEKTIEIIKSRKLIGITR